MAKTKKKEKVFYVRRCSYSCGDLDCSLERIRVYTSKAKAKAKYPCSLKMCLEDFIKITGIKLKDGEIKKVTLVELK